MNDANGHERPAGRPTTHGRYSLMRGLSRASRRTMLDRRTSVGKALAVWRAELLADLGGVASVSTQELALVEEAVKTKLILDSVDAWLLSQPTLVNKRNRGVLPAVRDRQTLVSTLRGLLGDLGLKRRSRALPSLGEYLATRSGNGASSRGSHAERAAGQTEASPGAQTPLASAAGREESEKSEEGPAAGGKGGDDASSPTAGQVDA